MTVDSNKVPNTTPEDDFLSAVERLEAGEALETVLATFPEEERAELRDLLTIVAATHHLQELNIPRPSPEHRTAAKADFLRAANEMKTAMAETVTPAIVPERARSEREQVVAPTVADRLASWWAELVEGLNPMGMRLAPLAIMVIAIWLGAFSVVSVAQAAIPGDVAYPAKTWVYEQKLTLSAPEDREEIYTQYVQGVAQDSIRAKERAAQEQTIIYNTADLILTGVGRAQIEAGDMTFELGYQESLSSVERLSTSLDGLPIQGAQATIEYQIVPETTDANGNLIPSQFQAISITIIKSPLAIPTTESAPAVNQPQTPVTSTGCVVSAPAGWIPYVVPAGSTLSGIASATGTSISQLIIVNCIDNPNLVRAGQTIMVPRAPVATATPTMPTVTATPLEVTLTAISTTQVTPSLTITAPVDVTPTSAVTATSTMTATEASDPSTPEPTVTVTTTVATATAEATQPITATVAPSVTPTNTEDEPTATPQATTVVTTEVTAEATPIPTVDSTETLTPVTMTPEPTSEDDELVDGAGTTATPVTPQSATSTPDETALPTAVTPIPTTTPETAVTPDGSATEVPTDSTDDTSENTTDGDTGESDEVSGASSGGASSEANPTASDPVPTIPPATATPIPPLPTATPTAVNRSPLNGG